MKKSEMVEVLARYINNNIQFRDDYAGAMKHADFIINELQQRGMYPPNKNQFFTGNDDQIRGAMMFRDLLSWEPEDE